MKMKPVENFHYTVTRVCASCKYLSCDDDGDTICLRDLKTGGDGYVIGEGSHQHDHVCDNYVRAPHLVGWG